MKTKATKQSIKITLLLEEQALILNTFQDKRFSGNHLAKSLCHKLLFLIPDQLPEALNQTGDSCRHPDQSPVAVGQDGTNFLGSDSSYSKYAHYSDDELQNELEYLSYEDGRVARGHASQVKVALREARDEKSRRQSPVAVGQDGTKFKPLPRSDERTLYCIALVGSVHVPMEIISSWTDDQCEQVEKWSVACHLDASDNLGVSIPDTPDCIKTYLDVAVHNSNQMDHYFCEECCSYPCKCPMGSAEQLTDSEFLSGHKYVPKDNGPQVPLSKFESVSCFQCYGSGTQIHSDEPCCCCSGTGKRIVEFL